MSGHDAVMIVRRWWWVMALVTLLIKTILEFRYGDELAGTRGH